MTDFPVLFAKDSPAFRCTNSEVTVQPSPYLSYGLPKDFVDLSTGEDAHKLIDFLKLVKYMEVYMLVILSSWGSSALGHFLSVLKPLDLYLMIID